jgi:hypothetical protein
MPELPVSLPPGSPLMLSVPVMIVDGTSTSTPRDAGGGD